MRAYLLFIGTVLRLSTECSGTMRQQPQPARLTTVHRCAAVNSAFLELAE